MFIVPVVCSCIAEVSSLRVGLPRNLKTADSRKKVLTTIHGIVKKYERNLPLMHPVRDMNLQDQDDLWFEITMKKGLVLNNRRPWGGEDLGYRQIRAMKRKMDIGGEVAKLEEKIKDSQVTVFNREIKLRSAVLQRLGHIDASGVLQLKGRAACEIDTADELLASELMLEGAFSSLDIHQVVAVTSCLVPVEKSQTQIDVQPALKEPLRILKETASHIAKVSKECGLDMNEEEYVDSFKPTLVNVVYSWSKGSKFSDICEMTDVFEGSIIRVMRRLNELLNQIKEASAAIGDEDLAEKFSRASESIQRGIVFANSLYIS